MLTSAPLRWAQYFRGASSGHSALLQSPSALLLLHLGGKLCFHVAFYYVTRYPSTTQIPWPDTPDIPEYPPRQARASQLAGVFALPDTEEKAATCMVRSLTSDGRRWGGNLFALHNWLQNKPGQTGGPLVLYWPCGGKRDSGGVWWYLSQRTVSHIPSRQGTPSNVARCSPASTRYVWIAINVIPFSPWTSRRNYIAVSTHGRNQLLTALRLHQPK